MFEEDVNFDSISEKWTLKTKYYTADLQFVSMPILPDLEEFKDYLESTEKIEALIYLFDDEDVSNHVSLNFPLGFD